MIFNKFLSRLLVLPVLALPLVALAAPAYTVTFAPAGFDILGYTATHINNRGQIVGNSGGLPAIWHGARVSTLPALAAHYAIGINNRGDIVGSSPNGPFVHTASGVRYISIPPPQDENRAMGLSDAGEVFGWSSYANGGDARGFVYGRRGIQLIGNFGGYGSLAYAINKAGHVVGHAGVPGDSSWHFPSQAFLYKNGVMRNLGALGGVDSLARDINDAGQIVGYAELPKPAPGGTEDFGEIHAFLYQRGTMHDLGTLGGEYSVANAINQHGVVVGHGSLATDWRSRAFVYQNRRMTDLNTRVKLPAGWWLTSAIDINDRGQILAKVCHLDDCTYWARLTPVRKWRHSSGAAGEEPSETADPADLQ